MSQAQPRISLLSEEQKNQLHTWSLRILGETGVQVGSPAARKLFAHPGGCAVDEMRVRIPAELVTSALETAPACVEVFDRLGQHAFTLGGEGTTRFGIGVTNLYYQNPETDALTPFSESTWRSRHDWARRWQSTTWFRRLG